MTQLTRQTDRFWHSRNFRITVVALAFVIFAVMMSAGLDYPSFWLDETITAGHISAPKYIHYDAFHPPGYYWLLLHWSYLFGAGDIALRAFSVLWALLAVVLVWLLSTHLLKPPSDLLSLWLFVLSPLALLYLRTARYFATSLALFLLVAYLLLLAVTYGRWRHYILLGVAAAGLLWTSYIASILLIPGYLWLLYSAYRRQPGYLPRWLVAAALPLLGFYPLAIKAIHSISAISAISQSAYLHGTLYGLAIKLGLPVYAAIVGENTAPWHFYLTGPVFLAGAVLMVKGFCAALNQRDPAARLKTWIWPAAIVAVAAVFTTVASSEPIVRVTSVSLFAVPFAYILVAEGSRRFRCSALATVLVSLILIGDICGIYNYWTGQQFLNPAYNVPWPKVVATIRSRWQPGDLVIECYEGSFKRYWDDETTMIEYYLPVPLADMQPVQNFPDSGRRIWLVARDRGAQLPRQMTGNIRTTLSEKATAIREFKFMPLTAAERRWRSRLLRRSAWSAYVKLYLFVP